MNKLNKNSSLNNYTHKPILKLSNHFKLDSGTSLPNVSISYKTYGSLNSRKTNAILVCHALTGDQYASGIHPITGKYGWWSDLIGPNLVLDTNKYFIICSNVLGGCMGTTGPRDINPNNNTNYGMNFPEITIGDMVKLQKLLIDSLKIKKLFCILGGSMGGMQVLEWARRYPEQVFSLIPIR